MITLRSVQALGRKGDELLNDRQEARFKQLNAMERLIFARMWKELSAELTETNGRITSKKGFVALGKAIDTVFDAIDAEHLGELGRNTVSDMRAVLDFNASYFDPFAPGKDLVSIKKSVDGAMRKRLGIDTEDGITKRGYLDKLFRNKEPRTDVKKMVAKMVAGGRPMKELEKALRMKVEGTKNTAGVLEKHIGGFVLDAYQVADSITNHQFAVRLGMDKYFLYSGGLIETSRAFCRKRNNKVFTVAESERWRFDPTLPRTKAEEESGVITDYVPIEDRGRWRCRHRIQWIPEEMAFSLRPDLRKAA